MTKRNCISPRTMNRFVLFPLLIFFVASCQDHVSTAPIASADFAMGGKPDCAVDPSHPKCTDGGGDEVVYNTTDLGTIIGKKATSAATGISDPFEGTRRISGCSAPDQDLAEDCEPVWWEVNDDGGVDGPHTLPGSFSEGVARGISEDGRYVAGYADAMPIRWDWDGATGWVLRELAPLAGYEFGIVFDVNDDGIGVGWSTSGLQTPVRAATLWGGSAPPVRLPNPLAPDGVSWARAITASGIVGGEVWDANDVTRQAIIWLAGGSWCLLGPGSVHGLDEMGEGVVLVSGTVGTTQGMVWKVDVRTSPCTATEWSLDPQDFGWSESGDDVAFDVRTTPEGWEAVGMSADAPVVWTWDGREVVGTQLADDLKARRVNRMGEIVGRSKVKGAWHGMLWAPNQP